MTDIPYTFRQFVKDSWIVYTERMKIRRAMRLLKNQEWSVEFLITLLNKAAIAKKLDVHLIVHNTNGQAIEILAKSQQSQMITREEELDVLSKNLSLEQLLDEAWINKRF